MSADDILLDVEERMEKTGDRLKHALAGIRTGRANPGLVDSLRVEVYGSQTPLKQLATVVVFDFEQATASTAVTECFPLIAVHSFQRLMFPEAVFEHGHNVT